MAKKTYTLTIRPLTGIHIGTGEELTPLDYKLTKSSSKTAAGTIVKTMYWKYSSDKILRRLIAEKKDLSAFERAGVNGNMGELQSFFQANCTLDDLDYLCDITKEFEQVYNYNRAKDPYDNAARVLSMYRPEGSTRPVIPGSSLKGSIRTAVLNSRLEDLENAAYEALLRESNESKVQKKVLDYDDAKNDPFRCISIRDSAFSAKDTQLVGLLKNISGNKTKDTLFSLDKLQIQAEVIRGELLEGAASAETSITIDTDLQAVSFPGKYGQSPSRITKLSMENIVESCNYFYWDEFKSEYEKFYKNVVDGTTGIIEELKKKLETALKEKDRFIIRLGRWSQVEFVTLNENFRKPEIRRRERDLGSGNTRTVFSYNGQFVPIGWCIMTIKETV
ncbi:type III-A CRISPR-associated RAMP protein Csm5 [Treponema sp. TIM-1]|uniref:type III-A CRISPR-associated RAMP protein Csm5 n=1 Tax=Treponema sp. TIM-1 TaxID=2898417 RepID=UPI0039803352